MTLRRAAMLAMAVLCPVAAIGAEDRQPGERYEITRVVEALNDDSQGGTGSSYDRDTLVERVVAVREDGIELEYDLPDDTSAEDRARQWKFPVRVLQPASEPMELLNRAELEARITNWLEWGEMPREACGQWVFTWNAFLIECDPEDAVDALDTIDLRVADLREGAPYRDDAALAAAPLARTAAPGGGAVFTTVMTADPEILRRHAAEGDAVVARIMREPLSDEDALRARAEDRFSGSIEVIIEADAEGQVNKRTSVLKLETRRKDGKVEHRTVTETITRRRLPD